MKKTNTEAKPRKQRYFGITKIKVGQKLSLISKQDKHGWSLGLALNKRTVWLTGIRFKTPEGVSNATMLPIHFIHKKK